MDKIPIGIKLLIRYTSFEKLDTWGISSSIPNRMQELLINKESNVENKERAFRQAVIEKAVRDCEADGRS